MAVPPEDKTPDIRGAIQYVVQSKDDCNIVNIKNYMTQANPGHIHYFYGSTKDGSSTFVTPTEVQFEDDVEIYFIEGSYPRQNVVINGVTYYIGWNGTSSCIRMASFAPLPSGISNFQTTTYTIPPLDPFYQLIINKISLDTYESITPNRFEFYIVDDGVNYLQTKNKVNALSSSNTYLQYPSAKAIYDAVSNNYQARDATYTKY